MFGSSARSSDLAKWTKLIILNEEMNDIKKIINSLEEPGLFIKSASETITKKSKVTKRRINRNVIKGFRC